MDRSQDNKRRRSGASMDGFFAPSQRPPKRDSHIYTPPAVEQRHQHQAKKEHTKGATHYPPSYLPPVAPPKTATNNEPPLPSLDGMDLSVDRPRRRSPETKNHRLLYRRIAAGFVALVLLVFIVGGGYIGAKFLKDTSKVFGGSIAGNIGDLFSTTKIKGEDVGRVNILLAGDSADDPGHQGAQLTDSIMVVSIDTKNNTGFLLSIPRDLWVNVPTMGHQKINSANEVSSFNESGYPKGGMGQLEQIVETDLGIPIDYYALIDYTAFKDAVDAVGGITVNINSPDPRGLFDAYTNLKLPNGNDVLNGQEALNLARARGDNAAGDTSYGFPSSDFDRTMHQREMLVALKTKATSIGVVTNPVKIGQLFDAVGNNVQTDLNLADILRLVQLTKGINNSAIQSLTYSEIGTNPLLTSYTSPDGQEALIPAEGVDNFTGLQHYYEQLASTNPVVKENANVVVLNGTNVSGVAKTAQTNLEAKGVNVTSIADASQTYPTSTIIDNSKGSKPATLALLKTIYGDNVTTKQLETSPSNPDFIVIIGTSTSAATTTSNTSQ